MANRIQQFVNALFMIEIDSYYVGGTVRDEIMGIPSDDVDICLVGVKDYTFIQEMLDSHFGKDKVTEPVGSFPVWIVSYDDKKYEFALARKEKLVGESRKDFLVDTENVTIEEDLLRRDFTMNAIAIHCVTGKVVDPYNGKEHIKQKLIHPVSDAFKEDTLRVYRGARFVAYFPDFTPSWDYYSMAAKLKPDDISNERVGMELMKVMQNAKKPSAFFRVLRTAGWLGYHFKELADLVGVPQSPTHHPEGDAFVHTLHTIDAATDWFTRTVMLCHDLGKADTTAINGIKWDRKSQDEGLYTVDNPKISAHGHEISGVPLTRKMLKRISFTNHDTINQIGCLVENHMIRTFLTPVNKNKLVRRTLRKLMAYGLEYSQLAEVVRCDLSGRPPKPVHDSVDIGQEHAAKLVATGEMVPIVTGRKLLDLGFTPGKMIGDLVEKGLELQDRGTLNSKNWKSVLKGWQPHWFSRLQISQD